MNLATTAPDPDLVTPGVVGFVITLLIAVATILLIIDMTRRIRRTRYREEIRAALAEEAAADRADGSPNGEPNGEDRASRGAGS